MPGFKIAGTIGRAVSSTNIDNKFVERIRKVLAKRAVNLEIALRAVCVKAIKDFVERNHVIKNLRNPSGEEGFDLQAEFGLKPGEAEAGIKALVDILIQSSINVKSNDKFSARNRNSLFSPTIEVLVDGTYEEQVSAKLKHSGQKQYKTEKAEKKSKQVNQNIDWGKWLMEANEGISTILGSIPSVKDFGISYNLTADQIAFSRSGRALMLGKDSSNKHRVDNFPYQFPRGAKPFSGHKNFVQEIAKNEQFRKQILADSIKVINRILFPR